MKVPVVFTIGVLNSIVSMGCPVKYSLQFVSVPSHTYTTGLANVRYKYDMIVVIAIFNSLPSYIDVPFSFFALHLNCPFARAKFMKKQLLSLTVQIVQNSCKKSGRR